MNRKIKKIVNRRDFVRMTTLTGAGISLLPLLGSSLLGSSLANEKPKNQQSSTGKRIGIIGLDTSHSEVFTKMINTGDGFDGYKVVAAYPHGSPDIASAVEMKPKITEAVKALGVEIVDSIDTLLEKVDFILLETNDGRPHLEQALPVLRAGKRMFIDKPIAHDFADAKKIFDASKKYGTPIFSSSALRYEKGIVSASSGTYGEVLGADVYTPAALDPNHIDFAWYGIHGVEMLFALLGTGCEKVFRAHTADTDLITGVWKDGKIGSVRGIRKGAANIAGTAFCENKIVPVGPFTTYQPLVRQIIDFFNTGIVPVSNVETLEMFRFMEAADKSKKSGKYVNLY